MLAQAHVHSEVDFGRRQPPYVSIIRLRGLRALNSIDRRSADLYTQLLPSTSCWRSVFATQVVARYSSQSALFSISCLKFAIAIFFARDLMVFLVPNCSRSKSVLLRTETSMHSQSPDYDFDSRSNGPRSFLAVLPNLIMLSTQLQDF